VNTATAILALVVLLVVAGYLLLGVVRRKRDRRAPWRLIEHSDGEVLAVYADRPGRERMLIGSVAIADEGFDDRLHDLRVEGRQKLLVLNGGRRV